LANQRQIIERKKKNSGVEFSKFMKKISNNLNEISWAEVSEFVAAVLEKFKKVVDG
jgi:hypothetical protein